MNKEEAEAKQYDLKAVDSNAPDFSDRRTTAELYKLSARVRTQLTSNY